jgi:O-antigen biosynthesis protein
MPSAHFISHHNLESAVTRYRCLNLAEALRSCGWEAQCSWGDDDELTETSADLIVLHRIFWTEEIEEFVRALKTAGKAVIYGVDDLNFTLDWPLKEASEYIPEEGWEDISDRGIHLDKTLLHVELTRQTMKLCDAVLVSTDLIADRARALGKDAFVIRNGLSEEQVALSEVAFNERFHREHDIVLGYLSGSRTHNSDFARIEPIVAAILDENPDVTLQIVGPLCLPPRLLKHVSRIHVSPSVPWRALPTVTASLDLNLSSLDTSFIFNYGKSHNRWLEAAAVGVPTIASRTPEFVATIEDGKNGLLAGNSAEWEQAIRKMVSDTPFRKEIAAAAKLAAKRHHVATMAQGIADEFQRILDLYGSPEATKSVVFPRKEVEVILKKPLSHKLPLYPFKWLGNIYRAIRSAFMGEYPF